MTLCGTLVTAHDFEVDGIYYNYGMDHQQGTHGPGASYVEVAASSNYSGNVVIPPTVTYGGKTYHVIYINSGAFKNCINLKTITIPSSIRSLGYRTFQGCTALDTLYYNAKSCSGQSTFPEELPFYNLNISTIIIGDSVQTIPYYFVYGLKSLKSLHFGNSLTYIDNYAFYGCSKLKQITLPYSIQGIGNYAFYNCEDLTDVTCMAVTPPSMGNYYTIYPAYYMATLHVPERSVNAYMATDWWNRFLTIIGDANDGNPTDDLDYMKCDTNGDGEVNIADVNRVIDAILSH